VFKGLLAQTKKFGLIINFTSMYNIEQWTLVCVYRSCRGVDRDNFFILAL
jgi:hypothetical protein